MAKEYKMIIKINEMEPTYITVTTRKKRTAISRALLKIFKRVDPNFMQSKNFKILISFIENTGEGESIEVYSNQ